MGFDIEDRMYDVHQIHSWQELQRLLESQFLGVRWVFGGQRDARWPLQTSFERVCANIEQCKWKRAEEHLLRQFRRRLHQYESVRPDVDDTLEWLALMQHHGAPTRLLDFTRSPFVAAYFAVEAAVSGCPSSIWIVNRQTMHNETLKLTPDLLLAITSSKTGALSNKTVFNRFFFESDGPTVIAVEPFRMNERLTVQQGLFLLPANVKASFLANLDGPPQIVRRYIPLLRKIELHLNDKGRLTVLEELRKMNIHRASLFPGIDGFAQSIATENRDMGQFR